MSRHTLNATATQVLVALMRLHDVTDTAAGKACGKDRTWIEARRNGRSKLKLDDLELLAEAFGIPPTVFFMEPGEAVKWSLDNPTDHGIRQIIWIDDADQAVSQPRLPGYWPELAGAA